MGCISRAPPERGELCREGAGLSVIAAAGPPDAMSALRVPGVRRGARHEPSKGSICAPAVSDARAGHRLARADGRGFGGGAPEANTAPRPGGAGVTPRTSTITIPTVPLCHGVPYPCGRRTKLRTAHNADGAAERVRRNGSRSVDVGRLVDAPDIAQRVAHLTHGGAGAQRLAQRVEQVVRCARRPPELVDPPRELLGVPAAAQHGQPFRLVTLDPGIDAQRLVRLFLGNAEPV